MKLLSVFSVVLCMGSAFADASPAWIEINPKPLIPTTVGTKTGSGAFDFLWRDLLISNVLDVFRTTPPTGIRVIVH